MGIDIGCAVYGARTEPRTLFRHVLVRLLERGSLGYAEVTYRKVTNGVSYMPLLRRDSPRIAEVQELVETLAEDHHLTVGLSFPLASGQTIPLYAQLVGKEYDEGLPARNGGRVRVNGSWGDFVKPLVELRKEYRHPDILIDRILAARALIRPKNPDSRKKGKRERKREPEVLDLSMYETPPIPIPDERLIAIVREIAADAEQLFLTVCGLRENDESTPQIDHAAMFEGCMWPSPGDCWMVYHRDTAEFGQDFARSVWSRSHQEGMPVCFEVGENLWEDEPKKRRARPARLPERRPGRPSPKEEFFSTLDREICTRVASTPTIQLELLLELLDSTPSDFDWKSMLLVMSEYAPPIRVHQLRERGTVVTTFPGAELWPVYAALLRLFKEEIWNRP